MILRYSIGYVFEVMISFSMKHIQAVYSDSSKSPTLNMKKIKKTTLLYKCNLTTTVKCHPLWSLSLYSRWHTVRPTVKRTVLSGRWSLPHARGQVASGALGGRLTQSASLTHSHDYLSTLISISPVNRLHNYFKPCSIS